jgi:hypothetical protein
VPSTYNSTVFKNPVSEGHPVSIILVMVTFRANAPKNTNKNNTYRFFININFKGLMVK